MEIKRKYYKITQKQKEYIYIYMHMCMYVSTGAAAPNPPPRHFLASVRVHNWVSWWNAWRQEALLSPQSGSTAGERFAETCTQNLKINGIWRSWSYVYRAKVVAKIMSILRFLGVLEGSWGVLGLVPGALGGVLEGVGIKMIFGDALGGILNPFWRPEGPFWEPNRSQMESKW